jgi:hypothetical protein
LTIGSEEKAMGRLLAGAAREDITPEPGIQLAGDKALELLPRTFQP